MLAKPHSTVHNLHATIVLIPHDILSGCLSVHMANYVSYDSPIPCLMLSRPESMIERKHVCMLIWLLSYNCIIQWSIAVVYPLWLYLLHPRPVTSSQEVVSLVYRGMQHRAADSTLIHEHSSRSHLIVTISIECRGTELSDATSMSSLVIPAHSQDSTTTMVGNKKIRELRQAQTQET